MTNKPLIDMTKKERAKLFAELNLTGTFKMLEDARNDTGDNYPMRVAVGILVTADGKEHYVFTDNEYGDGEGVRMVETFVTEVKETPGLLREGERIFTKIIEVVEVR